jgi:hypothetical protein
MIMIDDRLNIRLSFHAMGVICSRTSAPEHDIRAVWQTCGREEWSGCPRACTPR